MSLVRPGILRPGVHASGHHMVRLYPGNRTSEQVYVHRLVAEAFIPNPEGLPFVRHLDDNPANNAASNLAWGTRSDNGVDAVRNGINPNRNKTHCKNGHEFTPENTRVSAQGWRYCKACNTEAKRKEREAV